MKIKKFIQLNENISDSKEYYILAKHEYELGAINDTQGYFHLFDSYKNLYDYVICEIYYQLKNNIRALNKFEEQNFDNNVDNVLNYYNEIPEIYNLDKIEIDKIEIEGKVEYEDWIK